MPSRSSAFPEAPPHVVQQAESLREAGDLDRAEVLLVKGLREHGASAPMLGALAQVLADRGDAERSEAVWRDALALDEEYLPALRVLADRAEAAGRRDEATDYFRRLIRLENDAFDFGATPAPPPPSTPASALEAAAFSPVVPPAPQPAAVEPAEPPAARESTPPEVRSADSGSAAGQAPESAGSAPPMDEVPVLVATPVEDAADVETWDDDEPLAGFDLVLLDEPDEPVAAIAAADVADVVDTDVSVATFVDVVDSDESAALSVDVIDPDESFAAVDVVDSNDSVAASFNLADPAESFAAVDVVDTDESTAVVDADSPEVIAPALVDSAASYARVDADSEEDADAAVDEIDFEPEPPVSTASADAEVEEIVPPDAAHALVDAHAGAEDEAAPLGVVEVEVELEQPVSTASVDGAAGEIVAPDANADAAHALVDVDAHAEEEAVPLGVIEVELEQPGASAAAVDDELDASASAEAFAVPDVADEPTSDAPTSDEPASINLDAPALAEPASANVVEGTEPPATWDSADPPTDEVVPVADAVDALAETVLPDAPALHAAPEDAAGLADPAAERLVRVALDRPGYAWPTESFDPATAEALAAAEEAESAVEADHPPPPPVWEDAESAWRAVAEGGDPSPAPVAAPIGGEAGEAAAATGTAEAAPIAGGEDDAHLFHLIATAEDSDALHAVEGSGGDAPAEDGEIVLHPAPPVVTPAAAEPAHAAAPPPPQVPPVEFPRAPRRNVLEAAAWFDAAARGQAPAPAPAKEREPARAAVPVFDDRDPWRAPPALTGAPSGGQLAEALVRAMELDGDVIRADSSVRRLLLRAMGREMGVDEARLDALSLAATLGGLGGLFLGGDAGPDRATGVALHLLSTAPLPPEALDALRYQHSRWDGAGGAEGPLQEALPFGARLLAVARDAAALVTGPGRRGVEAAAAELQAGAGTAYDPVVVSVLRRALANRERHGIGYGVGGRVLVAHPRRQRAMELANRLHALGYEPRTVDGGIAQALADGPTVAVIAAAPLAAAEAGALRDLRRDPATAALPVVVVDAGTPEARVAGLTAGADLTFGPDASFAEVQAALNALLRRAEALAPAG